MPRRLVHGLQPMAMRPRGLRRERKFYQNVFE
jgi:hypothetical protein